MQQANTADKQYADLTTSIGSRRLPERPSLPLGGTLSFLSSIAALEEVEAGWRRLALEASCSHNAFQSFEWAMAWARTYGEADGASAIQVIAGHKGDRLVFLLPLMRSKAGPVRILRWLSEPFGQYGDVLLAAGEDLNAWMAPAMAQIRSQGETDLIRLRHVRKDATVYPFLERYFRSARVPEGAPFMDLSQFSDDAAYEQRYSKDQRKRRRKIRKEMEELGPVTFELLTGESQLAGVLEEAVAAKRSWLTERNLSSPAFACPKIIEMLKELVRQSSAEMQIVTSVLKAGERSVSWEIGLRCRDRHHGFITAHDVTLTDKSPARLHMDFSQRRALADGIRIFDLMVPMDNHKESWSSGVVAVDDHYLSLTPLGWLYGRAYLETLRPLLRNAYYNSSAEFRNAIARLTRKKFLMH